MVRQARVSAGYQVSVSEPKTNRGRRTIALDAGTVAVLKSGVKLNTPKQIAGASCGPTPGLVFTRENGTAWHPDRISKIFDACGIRLRASPHTSP